MKIAFGGETHSPKRPAGVFRLGGGLSIRLPGSRDAAPMGTERPEPKPASGGDPGDR